jgi:hypothetical protein
MGYKWQKCGNVLNRGFFVCPACRFHNESLEKSVRESEHREKEEQIWRETIEEDKRIAESQGYKTLRDYYKEVYLKAPFTESSGFLGLSKKTLPFNPDNVRVDNHSGIYCDRDGFTDSTQSFYRVFFIREIGDNSWMDASL